MADNKEKSSLANVCKTAGKLTEITPYKNSNNEAMYRLTVTVPALDEFEHPTKVAIHASSLRGRSVGQMVEVVSKASTYFNKGKDRDGLPVDYDQTRLYEIA